MDGTCSSHAHERVDISTTGSRISTCTSSNDNDMLMHDIKVVTNWGQVLTFSLPAHSSLSTLSLRALREAISKQTHIAAHRIVLTHGAGEGLSTYVPDRPYIGMYVKTDAAMSAEEYDGCGFLPGQPRAEDMKEICRPMKTPRTKLFLLPGLGATSEGTYASLLSSIVAHQNVECVHVNYPGHQLGVEDGELLPTMAQLVDYIIERYDLHHMSLPWAVLGHSMGALVAYELARQMEVSNPPLYVIVAASLPPQQYMSAFDPNESDTAFVESLIQIGGVSDELVGTELFQKHLLPVLKNDRTLLANYSFDYGSNISRSQHLISAPISVLSGSDDPILSPSDMKAWSHLTSRMVQHKVFDGDHFFVRRDSHATDISSVIFNIQKAASNVFDLDVEKATMATSTTKMGPSTDFGDIASIRQGNASKDELARRHEANKTQGNVPIGFLHEGFFRRASEYPSAIAVFSLERSLTFGTLRDEALVLSEQLKSVGVAFCDENVLPPRVCLIMTKSWQQIVGVYGVLSAGAAYVPIDGDWPKSRIEAVLDSCNPSAIVTMPRHEEDVKAILSARTARDQRQIPLLILEKATKKPNNRDLIITGSPNRLAYIIFTSGSTGTPKGVMIDHASCSNTVNYVNHHFGVSSSDVAFALSNFSFDLSVYDMFGLLSVGGSIVLPSADKKLEPAHWLELTLSRNVTVWNSVPQLFGLLSSAASVNNMAGDATNGIIHAFKMVFVSGDWVPLDLPSKSRSLFDIKHFVAGGGATEASIWSNWYEVRGTIDKTFVSIPYGRPMRNQTMFVLNDNLCHVKDGEEGEIFIGGNGLSDGYWGDSEKTSQKFIIHPDNGMRLYRTGDLGTYLPSGDISFLGRIDFQVKLRGNRIELGEIEAQMMKMPTISTAVCDVRKDVLIGWYIESESAESITDEEMAEALRKTLEGSLPTYMVPTSFVSIKSLPLSGNGKVVKKDLPSPQLRKGADLDDQLDFNALELKLAGLFEQVIGSDTPLGLDDNIFSLGLSSQSAIEAVFEIQKQFPDIPGAKVGTMTVFDHPTVRSLAKHIQGLLDNDSDDVAPEPVRLSARGVPSHGRAVAMRFLLMFYTAVLVLLFSTSVFATVYWYSWMAYACDWASPGQIFAVALAFFFVEPTLHIQRLFILIPAKWMLVGRLRPGKYSPTSFVFVRWVTGRNIAKYLVPTMEYFANTWVESLSFRLLGATIGRNVSIDNAFIEDWDLMQIGSDSCIAHEVSMTAAKHYSDSLELRSVTIESSVTIQVRAHVSAGQTVTKDVPWCCKAVDIEDGDDLDIHLPDTESTKKKQSNSEVFFWRGPSSFVWLASKLLQTLMVAVSFLPTALFLYGVFPADVKFAVENGIWSWFRMASLGQLAAAVVVSVIFADTVASLIFLLEALAVKRLLIGRFVEGEFDSPSNWESFREFTAWSLIRHPQYSSGMMLFGATPLLNAFYRLMGTSIGRGTFVPLPYIGHHELVTVEDYASFGSHAYVITRQDTSRGFIRKPVLVGRCSLAAHVAVLCPGSILRNSSIVGNRSAIFPDMECPTGSVWIGAPPQKLFEKPPHKHAHDEIVSSTDNFYGRYVSPIATFLSYVIISVMSFVFLVLWWTVTVYTGGPAAILVVFAPIVQVVGVILVTVFIKKTTIRQFRAETAPIGSFRWWMWRHNEQLQQFAGRVLLYWWGTPVHNMYWRWMGAKLGKDIFLGIDGAWELLESDLITIEDHAVIGMNAQFILHEITDHHFSWTRTKIGEKAAIGERAFLPGTISFGANSELEDAAQLLKGMKVNQFAAYANNPAAQVMEDSEMALFESSAAFLGLEDSTPFRVCIIGAGVSGMLAAYECHKRGVEFFLLDQNDDIGGVWINGANKSSYLQQNSDPYRLEGTVPLEPDFTPLPQLMEYFHSVAKKFNLTKHAQFQASVQNIVALGIKGKEDQRLRSSQRLFEINYTLGYGQSMSTHKSLCDAVIIATGKQQTPNIPDWRGVDRFGGDIINYTELDKADFAGRRVVIVGGGASAIEAVRTVYSAGATNVILLNRNPKVVYPRQLLHLITGVKMQNPRHRRMVKILLLLYYHRHGIDHMLPQDLNDLPEGLAVSDEFFSCAQEGHVEYIVDEIHKIERSKAILKSGREIKADIIVVATGWKPVDLSFLQGICGKKEPRFYKASTLLQDPKIGAVGLFTLDANDETISFPMVCRMNVEMVLNSLLHVECRRPEEHQIQWLIESHRRKRKQAFGGQHVSHSTAFQTELHWQLHQRITANRKEEQGDLSSSSVENVGQQTGGTLFMSLNEYDKRNATKKRDQRRRHRVSV